MGLFTCALSCSISSFPYLHAIKYHMVLVSILNNSWWSVAQLIPTCSPLTAFWLFSYTAIGIFNLIFLMFKQFPTQKFQVRNRKNCFLRHFGVGCAVTLGHFNVFLPRTPLYNPQPAKSGFQLWDLIVTESHQLSQGPSWGLCVSVLYQPRTTSSAVPWMLCSWLHVRLQPSRSVKCPAT